MYHLQMHQSSRSLKNAKKRKKEKRKKKMMRKKRKRAAAGSTFLTKVAGGKSLFLLP